MDTDLSPDTQVRSHRGQLLHQRSLERKTRQRLFACRAVDAKAGFLQHPIPALGVQVRQIAELAQGEEVTLYILNARFDDPLLGRICRRTGLDPETIAFGALGVGALHDRIVDAGTGDRALGVVDDETVRHSAEPLEGAAVTPEPGRHRLIEDKLQVLMTRETLCRPADYAER